MQKFDKYESNYKKIISPFGIIESIPQGWNYIKLENLVDAKDAIKIGPFGSSLKKHELVDSDGIKTIWIENIVNNRFNWDYRKYITTEKYKQLKAFTVNPGDILVTMMGTVGRIAIVPKNIGVAIISSHLLKIALNQGKCLPEFLYYYLMSAHVITQLNKESRGIVMQGLNSKIIRSLMVKLPTILEQQKIASLLSKVDELIQKTDQVIEQTQRLKKGLMQRLFSDSFLTHFQLFSIGEIKASIRNAICMGPFGSSIKTDNFVPSGIPVIRGVNLSKEPFNLDGFVFIRKEKADELRSANAFPGDIVFTHRGTLGQVGVIPDDTKYDRFVISQSQMKLTCDRKKVIPLYAYYFFKSQRGQNALLSNISATGVPAIGQPTTTLRQIKIPLPALSEQQKVVNILSKADNLIKNRQGYKGRIENLKKGLMQKLLTGKIRVKV